MSSVAHRRGIVQVHPTRRCNLRCAHCYTSSGPLEQEQIPPEVFRLALADAGELGYSQLAVSGGEPLLYRELPALLAAGREAGLVTSATTNGTLSTPQRLEAIAPHLDLLAVSVDGPAVDHNLLRSSPSAFDRLHRHLPAVRSAGIVFGFVFTLTRFNVDQLDWLAVYAVDEGAAFVQIHPLNMVGRAASELPGYEPDGLELLAAIVETERLRTRYPDLELVVDAATRDQFVAHRDFLVPGPSAAFAELVPNLIIDDCGTVRPLTHDLHAGFDLGSLLDAPLLELAARWSTSTADDLRTLLTATYDRLVGEPSPLAAHWFDAVAEVSRDLDVRSTGAAIESLSQRIGLSCE